MKASVKRSVRVKAKPLENEAELVREWTGCRRLAAEGLAAAGGGP